MYHELTYEEIARRRRNRIIVAVLCVVLCAIIVALGFFTARASRQQAVSSIRDSVTAAAAQCAAVEGSYPSTLAHLEEYYGLVINHERYIVQYEWFADNIPPTVVVRTR